jgi:SH3-like domain-containing protein
MKLILILFFLCISLNLYGKTGSVTGLEIPRFVSLKSNDVNIRVGPSINYPIKLKYIFQNYPLEIIDEFDVWRKSRDHDGNIGWVHKSLIKGERYILTGDEINANINLFSRPNGKIKALIKNKNILELKSCTVNWCKVSKNRVVGWILKENIWGIYENEIYDTKFYQPIINQYWKILNSKILN